MTLSVLALVLLVLLVILLGWPASLPQERTPWRDQAVSLVGIVGAPVLGGLIAARRPENPYGWLWLVFGLASPSSCWRSHTPPTRWWWIPERCPPPRRSPDCWGWEDHWH